MGLDAVQYECNPLRLAFIRRVSVRRRGALQHKDKNDRHGRGRKDSHGDDDDGALPVGLDDSKQKEAKRPLFNGHADDGKDLADGFVENGGRYVVWVLDLGH
jgi:hypothetical protein